ncbi:flagellar protein FliS [Sporosarcina sp. Te-1]|uniref:flagellar protein FliS n=1 Tax=Sporosarcina sp. Te-1 TaxID=2818390 RepID=UPI001A9F3F81|nr:flagellar protein FliS [Sporosarcina sp. Te-1]QTD41170.1 flagellar protein FliS [Sporosarcina sp. Te-1]
MNVNRAMKIYKETHASTIPTMEYIILLLKETIKNIRFCQQAASWDEVQATLSKTQDLLFELMASADRSTEEGERLFTFYVYLNQLIVDVQIQKSTDRLTAVEVFAEQLIEAWEEAQQRTRQRNFTSNMV